MQRNEAVKVREKVYFTVIIKVHIFNNGDINTVLTYDQIVQLHLTFSSWTSRGDRSVISIG